MGHLVPTEEQIQELSGHAHAGPIWMWNLLRFEGGGGRDSYQQYVQAVKPLTPILDMVKPLGSFAQVEFELPSLDDLDATKDTVETLEKLEAIVVDLETVVESIC